MLCGATEEATNMILAEDTRQQNINQETLRRIHTEAKLKVMIVHNIQLADEINKMRRRLEERERDGDVSSGSIHTVSENGEDTDKENQEESIGEAIISNVLDYTANNSTINLTDTNLEDSVLEASETGKDATRNTDT